MVLEGCRKYYATASGTVYPDVINRFGGYVQLKGIEGGFDVVDFSCATEAIEADYSNAFGIASVDKNGLHLYKIPSHSMYRLVEADIIRESKGRYRIRRGLMKHAALLRGVKSKYWNIPKSESITTLYRVQSKIDTISKDGRLIP